MCRCVGKGVCACVGVCRGVCKCAEQKLAVQNVTWIMTWWSRCCVYIICLDSHTEGGSICKGSDLILQIIYIWCAGVHGQRLTYSIRIQIHVGWLVVGVLRSNNI